MICLCFGFCFGREVNLEILVGSRVELRWFWAQWTNALEDCVICGLGTFGEHS
jgi:hypothetical protein